MAKRRGKRNFKKGKSLGKAKRKEVKSIVKRELENELELKRYLAGLSSTTTPKIVNVVVGGPYGNIEYLSGVPQDTTVNSPYGRIGNKIMPKMLRLKIILTTAPSTTEPWTYVRIIIFRYKQSPDEGGFSGSGGQTPSLGPFVDLNSPTATTTSLFQPILAQKDIDYAKTHVVLMDKIYNITQYLNFYNEGFKCSMLIQKNFKLPPVACQYTGPAGGTTNTNLGPNNYFMMIIPSANNKIQYQYMSELYYTDA